MEAALQLLIRACRLGYGAEAAETLARDLRAADRARLSLLARRHRVEGLTWRALQRCQVMLPGTETLGQEARRIVTLGLRTAAESQRLHRAFAAASLPHLFVKGQVVGKLAWGDAMLKKQLDLDLLVEDRSVGRAAALLSHLGYVIEVPDPSVDPADWHRRHKESVWRSEDGQLVDLHSRLADNRLLLPTLTATMTGEQVEIIGDISLPTLPRAMLLPYLAVHGGSSAWFRLKWLADFAAIVAKTDPAALAKIADRAERLGAGRSLAAALVLSHRLFATPLPDDLWFDGGARKLVALSIAAMSNPAEPTERRLGTLAIHRAQLLLAPGRGYLLSELTRQVGGLLTR